MVHAARVQGGGRAIAQYSKIRADDSRSRPPRYNPRVIRLENLSKRYPGAEIDVLRGIDLMIEPQDFVSLVGRSGSGKTTLLNIIGGLDRAFEGKGRVAELDLRALADAQISDFRNRVVGHVFQAYHLLDHLTCRENVALAALFTRGETRRDAAWIRSRADELLDAVGLPGSGARRPSTLSGGERQRIAIARALFNRPQILLCDEPTGNLDPRTSSGIHELLLEVNRDEGQTMVLVTHDEEIAVDAHRVCRMVDGRLEDETPVPPADSPRNDAEDAEGDEPSKAADAPGE